MVNVILFHLSKFEFLHFRDEGTGCEMIFKVHSRWKLLWFPDSLKKDFFEMTEKPMKSDIQNL